MAPIGATVTVGRAWLAFDEACTFLIGPVSEPVAIVVDAIRTLCFAVRRCAAIARAVALIFTFVAVVVTANGWRTAVDFAVEAVFDSFTHTVAAT